jgi:hypothetical protein
MLAALAINALTSVKYTVEYAETGDTDFYVTLYIVHLLLCWRPTTRAQLRLPRRICSFSPPAPLWLNVSPSPWVSFFYFRALLCAILPSAFTNHAARAPRSSAAVAGGGLCISFYIALFCAFLRSA